MASSLPWPGAARRRPGIREPLRPTSVPGPAGSAQEVLVGVYTGETFPIRDGIPLLLDEPKVPGFTWPGRPGRRLGHVF
jgi:uncharacterized protein YbaR (Trm112 family)